MKSLSPTRWNRIQFLLEESLDLSIPERQVYLNRVCKDDPVIREQLETLLKAHDQAPDFLEGNAVEFAEPLLSALSGDDGRDRFPDCSGKMIGPYRLTSEVGRGGMGLVYQAERVDGTFEQQVAIKLLPSWPGQRLLLERFKQEQQVLASLNHPNIASLYDGGVTEEGWSYIVMEYVEGIPLTDYCETHELDIDARLTFVCQVADGLQHAHRNLIVHRDIKPANILVTDGGQVKILDFGIAKLLSGEAIPTDLTRAGEQLLTPGFAAPEQLMGQPVSVATDVYQLGAILYELLTGRRPFVQRASYYEMSRMVCEKMPASPSTALSDSYALSGGRKVEQRQRERKLARLQKALRGDLDAIVLKTLRKEPEQRYESVRAFAADLNAYRRGRPVAARQQSWSYNTTKFIKRHTLGVAAGLVLLALIVSYVVTITVQVNKTERALDRAQIEASKAQQVSGFLAGLFKISDPNVSGTETVTARALLEEGRRRIPTELADVPEIQAQLSYVMGEIYYNLGSYEESVVLLESALQKRRLLLTANDTDLALTMVRLGMAYNTRDRYDEAGALFEEALAIYNRQGIESVGKGEALNTLGSVRRKQGDFAEAEAYYKQAIALLREVTGGNHYELAVALNNLAALQLNQGELATAERHIREAVALQERILGPEHSYVSIGLLNLGAILARMERYEEAKPFLDRALSIQEKILGSEHAYVAYTLWSFGNLMQKTGNTEDAEDYLKRALTIHESVSGRQSAVVASSLSRLGSVLQDQGRLDEAERQFREALQIDVAVLGPESARVGRDYSRLASLAYVRRDYEAARSQYENALRLLPASREETARANLGYARVLVDLDESSTAEKHARIALNFCESNLPAGHSMTIEALSLLNSILANSNDLRTE